MHLVKASASKVVDCLIDIVHTELLNAIDDVFLEDNVHLHARRNEAGGQLQISCLRLECGAAADGIEARVAAWVVEDVVAVAATCGRDDALLQIRLEEVDVIR